LSFSLNFNRRASKQTEKKSLRTMKEEKRQLYGSAFLSIFSRLGKEALYSSAAATRVIEKKKGI